MVWRTNFPKKTVVWEEVLKLQNVQEMWPVVQYDCLHVVEFELEVVVLKKIGCEPKDFEALQKLDFLEL